MFLCEWSKSTTDGEVAGRGKQETVGAQGAQSFANGCRTLDPEAPTPAEDSSELDSLSEPPAWSL